MSPSPSGWYLRGDIGMTNQQFHGIHQRLYDVPGTSVDHVGFAWDSGMFAGLGLGYKINDWFRADVTGEYRGKTSLHGSDSTTFNGGAGVDNYSGTKSEWVFLANAYFDLGTWWCVTPYIGAGVGMADIMIKGFRDDGFTYIGGVLNNSTAYAEDASKWNFAWAVHAGLTYKVTQAMSIDLGYRYLNMGTGTTGATRAFDGQLHQRRAVHLQEHRFARLQDRRAVDARAAGAEPADHAAPVDAARLNGPPP